MSFLKVDLGGLRSMLDEMGDASIAAARPVAQAVAQVLYDEVKRNVQSIGRKTGNLDNAIYQAFSQANSGPGHATYHVSWNPRKAPHGYLIEFGYIQRYKAYIGKDGRWHTAIRRSMRGQRKPSRRASQEVKDAYYVPLATPRQVPARSFLRAAQSKFPAAMAVAEAKLLEIINRGTRS
ncbi:HK97 gp10 family phage protein [Pseudoduganella sp. RAF19]|uniref:HK97 gp10 family phage protein n=1 Tax=Bacteria TaxID=2 RepID=UPI003F9730EF